MFTALPPLARRCNMGAPPDGRCPLAVVDVREDVGSQTTLPVPASREAPQMAVSGAVAAPQTVLSASTLVPHTTLAQSAPPQSVPHTMFSTSLARPQTMLAPSPVAPQRMSPASSVVAPLTGNCAAVPQT